MVMFSSAHSALYLYIEASDATQDHPHPITGCGPPPTRWRRIASRKCEEPSRGDIGRVSRGSMSRGRFPGFSLVWLSQTAIVAVLHCNRSDQFVVDIFVMSMNKGAHSNLSCTMATSGERGELIVAGQVSKATERGGRRTVLTGGVGPPIGSRPSGSLGEDARGAQEG